MKTKQVRIQVGLVLSQRFDECILAEGLLRRGDGVRLSSRQPGAQTHLQQGR